MAEKRVAQIIPHQSDRRIVKNIKGTESESNIDTTIPEPLTKECDEDETEDLYKDALATLPGEQHQRPDDTKRCDENCDTNQMNGQNKDLIGLCSKYQLTPTVPEIKSGNDALFDKVLTQKCLAEVTDRGIILAFPNDDTSTTMISSDDFTNNTNLREEETKTGIGVTYNKNTFGSNSPFTDGCVTYVCKQACDGEPIKYDYTENVQVNDVGNRDEYHIEEPNRGQNAEHETHYYSNKSLEMEYEMSGIEVESRCGQMAYCGDPNQQDKQTQCNLNNECLDAGFTYQMQNFRHNCNGGIMEEDLLNVEDGHRMPMSVSSDTMLCCGYKNINRSGRLFPKNAMLWDRKQRPHYQDPQRHMLPTVTHANSKRKRRRIKSKSKDPLDLLFEDMSDKSSKNGDGSDVSDTPESSCCDEREGKDFNPFQYIFNNCMPLSNLFKGLQLNASNLNTTNSCDPSNSDNEDQQGTNHKSQERKYLTRFDNLSSNTGCNHMKEFLSTTGNNNKYTPGNYANPDKHRTGMFLNTLNKKKIEHGKHFWTMDGGGNTANNRIVSDQDKCKVQASQFIGEYLYELWKNECLCDVSIKVGSQSYLAHKIVLAAFSDVFCPSEPMPTPTLMVDVPNSSPNAVFEILQYLYTSEMKITDDSLEDILNAALFLGVTDVVELIKDILSHPTKENVVHYLGVADRMQMPVNINDTPQLFREYLHEIWDSEIFKHINEEEMRKLLSDQMIMVDSETDLIIALSKWAEGDLDKRVKLVPKLLKYINFVRIEPDDLAKTTDNYPHIFNNTECQAILAEVYKSFAIIETSALKENNGYGGDMHRSSSEEIWRPPDQKPMKNTPEQRQVPELPSTKSHLNPDTDATRRSINNQFRRASRRMSQTPKLQQTQTGAQEQYSDYRDFEPAQQQAISRLSSGRRIQFDDTENTTHQFSGTSTFTRKDTAMPKPVGENSPVTLHRRSLGVHDQDYSKSDLALRGPPTKGGQPRDYFAMDSDSNTMYDNKGNTTHVSDTAVRASVGRYGDFAIGNQSPVSKTGLANREPIGRDPIGIRESPSRGVRESPSDDKRYRMKDSPSEKKFAGKDSPSSARQNFHGRESLRDAGKQDTQCTPGTATPMSTDSECCYVSPFLKCPTTRLSCCNMDCSTPCGSSIAAVSSDCKTGNGATGNSTKGRNSVREQGRASIRDTARTSRRASTKSPIRQSTRSPPYRRSTTPPPRRSVTPPARRSVTPPAGVRRSKMSPTRDMARTPQRRSMRMSIREGNESRNGNYTRQLEHNYSPTVINESSRPSVTRKVLQNYKQDNPETYNISTPNSGTRNDSPTLPRKSREDIPLVFGGKD